MSKIMTINDAMVSLYPKENWMMYGDRLDWLEKNKAEPTKEELDAEVIRLQAEYDAQEYARNREAEYPSTGDQLDYIFHYGVAKWKTDMIEPVKTKYPKPS